MTQAVLTAHAADTRATSVADAKTNADTTIVGANQAFQDAQIEAQTAENDGINQAAWTYGDALADAVMNLTIDTAQGDPSADAADDATWADAVDQAAVQDAGSSSNDLQDNTDHALAVTADQNATVTVAAAQELAEYSTPPSPVPSLTRVDAVLYL